MIAADVPVAVQLEPGSRGRAGEGRAQGSRVPAREDRGVRGGAAAVPERGRADGREPRRAVAEWSVELSDSDKAEALFEQWLTADPRWGWGWIGWADLHFFFDSRPKDYGRAEELLGRGGSSDRLVLEQSGNTAHCDQRSPRRDTPPLAPFEGRLVAYDCSQSRSRRKCSDRICSRVLPTRSPSLKRTSSW